MTALRPSILGLLGAVALSCTRLFEYPADETEQGSDRCRDGNDNDLDGRIDCADTSCDGWCSEVTASDCTDRRDNDGDMLTDAADAGCWVHATPLSKRCGEASGVEIFNGFDLAPSLSHVWSAWDEFGYWLDSADGMTKPVLVTTRDSHVSLDDGRQDGVISLSYHDTTQGALQLSNDNLGGMVRQHALSGSWQDFELGFRASAPEGSIVSAGLVPIELAPSNSSPLPGARHALAVLSIDRTHAPPILALDVEGERHSAALEGSRCSATEPCKGMDTAQLTLRDDGFYASLVGADGSLTELHAPAPKSAGLPVSKLVLWGGTDQTSTAVLVDDLTLSVKPAWPCGFSVPQVPGQDCQPRGNSTTFGHGVSVARAATGDYCAIISAGPSAAAPPETLTTWHSDDAEEWKAQAPSESSALELPEGAELVGGAVAADADGWHAAVAYRSDGVVRLGLSDSNDCADWSQLSRGPTLFADAEAPSYVIQNAKRFVYFTRSGSDVESGQPTGRRKLWRVLADASDAVAEELAELPSDVGPPVSVSLVGNADLALVYPIAPSAGVTGAGILVSNATAEDWQRVEPSPVLGFPLRLESWEGQTAFDDRGLAAATLSWQPEGGFLLYSGLSIPGWLRNGFEPALSVGTALMLPADQEFAALTRTPGGACGDGSCNGSETCSSCEVDCPCVGVTLESDLLGTGKSWQRVSADPTPGLVQYRLPEQSLLNWNGGAASWSFLPLERTLNSDFALSFDMLAADADKNDNEDPACSLYVGLGKTPQASAAGEIATPDLGGFARLARGTFCNDRYSVTPFVLNASGAFQAPLPERGTGDDIMAECPSDQYASPDGWVHVVVAREGSSLQTTLSRQSACGSTEQSVSYAGPLSNVDAVLVGFGGDGFEACPQGAGGGTIAKLELRVPDDPAECRRPKQLCTRAGGEPSCVDLSHSNEHCGECNHACAEHEVCDEGACVCAEFGGTLLCGDSCVDPLTSLEHCGECNHACTERCVAGVCDAIAVGDCTAPFQVAPEGGEFPLLFPEQRTNDPYTALCDYGVVNALIGSWTPEASGTATVEVDVGEQEASVASGLDSVVGITDDASCLDWLSCNDDITSTVNLSSRLRFPVVAGTSYRIGLGLWDYRPPQAQRATLRVRVE